MCLQKKVLFSRDTERERERLYCACKIGAFREISCSIKRANLCFWIHELGRSVCLCVCTGSRRVNFMSLHVTDSGIRASVWAYSNEIWMCVWVQRHVRGSRVLTIGRWSCILLAAPFSVTRQRLERSVALPLPAAIHLSFHPPSRSPNQWQPSKTRSAGNTHNLPPTSAGSHTLTLWDMYLAKVKQRVLWLWKSG